MYIKKNHSKKRNHWIPIEISNKSAKKKMFIAKMTCDCHTVNRKVKCASISLFLAKVQFFCLPVRFQFLVCITVETDIFYVRLYMLLSITLSWILFLASATALNWIIINYLRQTFSPMYRENISNVWCVMLFGVYFM